MTERKLEALSPQSIKRNINEYLVANHDVLEGVRNFIFEPPQTYSMNLAKNTPFRW